MGELHTTGLIEEAGDEGVLVGLLLLARSEYMAGRIVSVTCEGRGCVSFESCNNATS